MTIRKMSPRGRRLAAALFLTTALSSVAAFEPALAQNGRAYNAFLSSGHNYCDAKLVGALWGMSPERGKVEIGQKVLDGIGGNVRRVLMESRRAGNQCSWEDTGLSYSDAESLAATWGMRTPYQAKLKAARHFTMGRVGHVRNALGG